MGLLYEERSNRSTTYGEVSEFGREDLEEDYALGREFFFRWEGTCVPERKRDEVTLASKNHKRPGRIRDVGLPPWKDGFPNDTYKYLQVGKRRPAEEENTESKEKARNTHADIMSHWINKEFHILEILIETTNEKGWHAEYPC
ncbi:hypothetical protein OsI_07315 [Oryza sativa Indica Group]|uniref:NERD domain-containing protein n=1 Tax=Oryza sativa subsp. indica TaxID=39946 RepID=B8AIB1_ORYSI|nr:hypothetical protein OsI_07315 [Oryza sativa Indica Group]